MKAPLPIKRPQQPLPPQTDLGALEGRSAPRQLALSLDTCVRASNLPGVTLRSLDAPNLAAALEVGATEMYTYDAGQIGVPLAFRDTAKSFRT